MATTLILSTSCAPVKRPAASSHDDSASTVPSSTSGWSDVGNNGSSAAKVKNTCDTTGHTAIDNDAGDTNNFHGGHSCHHHHVPSSSILGSHTQGTLLGDASHGQSLQRRHGGVEFIDNLQALPLQCDITIIPRAHPNDSSANATSSLDANHHVNSHDDDDNESMNILQPIRITKQHFHPCGIDNIVRLANTVSSDFILSLANCGVTVGSSMNENEEVRILPVQAVPSSFAIPSFDSRVEDEMGRGGMPYSYSGGEAYNVEEVAVSFDFSIAVDVYQHHLDESAAAAAMLNHNNKHNHRVNNQSWNQDGTTRRENTAQHSTTTANMKSMEINSIMSTLENESQFIKKTLVVLGSFGFGLLICMVWTIWKLERGRRARRSGSSRVQVKKVFVDNVPFEIIGATHTTAAAANKSRGGVTSLRSHPSLRSNNGKAHFPEEISPIRSSVSLNEAEEEEKVDGLPATALDNREATLHETLHLITPQDVTGSSGSSTSNNEEGGKQSSSPRHWYEDFLSPRGCSKKAPRNRSDDVLFSGNEEVARSLFCSSSSSDSNKVSPATMDNKTSFDKSKGATSSSVLNAPKKKVLVTPIDRSSMSPPPSDISPLKLSKDMESSKSPLMMSTETEETHDSSTRGDLDEPPSSIGVVEKEEGSCTISPISMAATEETSESIRPDGAHVNTPKPKRSRALKTPATDISISSQESQTPTTQKSRETLSSTRGGIDKPPPSIDVAKEHFCSVSPVSMAATSESSESIKPRGAQVITPKPKRSRTLKTPATDISISSQESQSSTSQTRKARKKFAEELAKKAGLTPPPANKSDFSSSIKRRAAEVQTPKKTLTPLSASSSPCDDEPSPFLADYW
ncbi:hypothetical protein QTG54_008607 [Skeletonema marinoi]|uniref:Uncharacterized protein n=1 Tax=Skeletonema marinoi TaxID=267567 RepID=A0AAD8Y7M6_9STRA|nr:hypothetical protein QTG54_008607 [Skeletonema marinoi]